MKHLLAAIIVLLLMSTKPNVECTELADQVEQIKKNNKELKAKNKELQETLWDTQQDVYIIIDTSFQRINTK